MDYYRDEVYSHGSATKSKATGEGSLFNVPLFRMYEPVYTNILSLSTIVLNSRDW